MGILELDYQFDGNVKSMKKSIETGGAFRINGRPLSIPNVIAQGDTIIVPLVDRTLIIDLTEAQKANRIKSPVQITLRFE